MTEPAARIPVEVTDVRGIHPAIKNVWRFSALMGFLFYAVLFVGGGFIVSRAADFPAAFGLAGGAALALLFTIPSVLLADRQWKNWTYQLRERDLVLTWGVFWQTRRCVARDRIQHIDINSGPMDRRFGLVQVVIHTAGMSGSVATIPGLRQSEAEFLRQQLLDTRDPEA